MAKQPQQGFLNKRSLHFKTLIVLFFLGGMISCENSLEEIQAITIKDAPIEFAENIEMIHSDSAVVEFVLSAPVLERYKHNSDSSYLEFPKGVEVVFFNQQGDTNTIITSDYAINYESDDRLLAKKNVKIINAKGDILTGEDLWWDKESKKIYSNDFVKIVTKDEVIYGRGLEANEDFSWYKILDIEGILNVNKNEYGF